MVVWSRCGRSAVRALVRQLGGSGVQDAPGRVCGGQRCLFRQVPVEVPVIPFARAAGSGALIYAEAKGLTSAPALDVTEYSSPVGQSVVL